MESGLRGLIADKTPHTPLTAAFLPYSTALPLRRLEPRFAFWAIVVLGYLTYGRLFAYIGVPPLFIGELYLAWGVIRSKHHWVTRAIDDCLHLRLLPLAIVMHLIWGIVEIVHAVMLNRSIIEVLRVFSFNYYPLYVLLGIAIGRDIPLYRFIQTWKKVVLGYCGYVICSVLTNGSKIFIPPAPIPPSSPSPSSVSGTGCATGDGATPPP